MSQLGLALTLLWRHWKLSTAGRQQRTEKTAKDIKLKYTAQKNEMMKTLTDNISKILNKKLTEVDKVYDPAVEAEAVTKYLERVEKSLHPTNDLLKNSKLQELIAAHKRLDVDIQMLQDAKTTKSNIVSGSNPGSCVEKLPFYVMFTKLTKKCRYLYVFYSDQFSFIYRNISNVMALNKLFYET